MARNKSPFNYLAQLEKSEEKGLFEEVSNPLQKTTVPFATQADKNTQASTQPAIGTQEKVQDWDVNELLDHFDFNPGEGETEGSGYMYKPTYEESTVDPGGGGMGGGAGSGGSGEASDWENTNQDCYAQWQGAQSWYSGSYNEFASYYCGG